MDNHLDDKGLHISDDGERKFGTVLGFVLRNTRTHDYDGKGCNFDFSKEITESVISVFGHLTPEAGLTILEKIQEGLDVFIGDDRWSAEARLKRKHAFLADYIKDWLQGGLACVGRSPEKMRIEELLALLNENPLRLKWLAPALFANDDIKRAEANTLCWVVRDSNHKIDIQATVEAILRAGHRTYDPSEWEVYTRERRNTTIEAQLHYLPRPVLDPFNGKISAPDSALPYELLPEVRSRVVQWGIAAQHPGIQVLRDNPRLLFHVSDRPPVAYARLKEDFSTAPVHDQRLFSRFSSDAIVPGHPEYPAPGPYLWR